MSSATIEEGHERLTAVRRLFAAWDVEGLLVTNASNRRWLSGFTGSAGRLLVTHNQALLATDFRYWQLAGKQAPHFTLHKHRRRRKDEVAFFARAGQHLHEALIFSFGERD